jgi:outer membrane lipoprotein SlyB
LLGERKENNAMQSTTSRLHPLLVAAAVSVIVFSAVGAATLTGLIPLSKSQESPLELPKEVVKPIAPAISHQVKKPVARKAAPKPVEAPVYQEFSEIAQAAPAPAASPAPVLTEAPKPQVQPGQLAVVESVRELKHPGDAKGIGAIAGGVVGGVLGNKLGKGNRIGTVMGALGGAFGGHQIEKHARGETRWETAVRLDDGTQRTISSDVQPAWRAGERVRLLDGKLLPV